jgi:hypothetical protein
MEKRTRSWILVLSAISVICWGWFFWAIFDGQVSRVAYLAIFFIVVSESAALILTLRSHARELKQAKNDTVSWQNSYTRSLLSTIGAMHDCAEGQLSSDKARDLRNTWFAELVAALNEGVYLNKCISNKRREALKTLVLEAAKKGRLEYPSKARRQLFDLLDLDED